jgi:hypothetical protein
MFGQFGNIKPTLAQALTPRSVNAWQRPPYLGTTFSPLQCYYMNLDFRAAFQQICTLGLKRIRLGAYWNVIQKQVNQNDFSELDWLLDQCDKNNIEAVVAVGMKVPRWPEFHFPQWVSDLANTGAGAAALDQRSPIVAELALDFTKQVVERCKAAPAVKYWQIENEPFTRLEIAGGRFLSPEFVQKEVELVRSLKLPTQKILLTNAIHLPNPKLAEDQPALEDSIRVADAIGINVYTKVPTGSPNSYLEPTPTFWRTLQNWQGTMQQNQREAWIAEAQAEPWENQQLVAMGKPEYPSASPQRMRSLVGQLSQMGYSTVLLWGCEYWYWQKLQGRNLWWWTVQQLAQAPTNQPSITPPPVK